MTCFTKLSPFAQTRFLSLDLELLSDLLELLDDEEDDEEDDDDEEEDDEEEEEEEEEDDEEESSPRMRFFLEDLAFFPRFEDLEDLDALAFFAFFPAFPLLAVLDRFGGAGAELGAISSRSRTSSRRATPIMLPNSFCKLSSCSSIFMRMIISSMLSTAPSSCNDLRIKRI
jgi:hypothetical protein